MKLSTELRKCVAITRKCGEMNMACPSHLVIPRLLRPSPLFLLKPPSALSLHHHHYLQCRHSSLSFSSFPCSSPRLIPSSISAAPSILPSLRQYVVCSLPVEHDSIVGEPELEDSGEQKEEGIQDDVVDKTEGELPARVLTSADKRIVPELSVKEKKELASYAHSLGDKLKSQQVGKSGVTYNVAMALNETMEANELLKLKIHRTCPGELDDIVKELEQYTGSAAVSKIGRTVIFYRPSISKMKAEEKRKQARKVFEQRKQKPKPAFETREQGSRESGRSARGGSKFLSS